MSAQLIYGDVASDVIRRCRTLAAYSDESGVTTRTFLSESFRAVHADLSAWMTRTGMSVRVDSAGNLRGVYAARSAEAPRLLIGSHLDTVPQAGAFDGVLGVVMGIALVEALHGRRLPFSVEIVGFSEEEGIRFGVPFIGSLALAGRLDTALLALRDARGISVSEAIRDYGLDPSRVADARAEPGSLGYLEFHIEQGPVLDMLHLPIAVVEAIIGRSCADVVFTGVAGHAGTTPMASRRDALAGAAQWICRVTEDAGRTPGLVATTGQIEVAPGAANVIPGRCRVSLDVRHADDHVRTAAVARLRRVAEEITSDRRLGLEWTARVECPSTAMDGSLVEMLARAVERSGAPRMMMSSGAGHDAVIVAAHMPAAMVFIRSPLGVSHHPDECVVADDVSTALAVGMNFLDELASAVDCDIRFAPPGLTA